MEGVGGGTVVDDMVSCVGSPFGSGIWVVMLELLSWLPESATWRRSRSRLCEMSLISRCKEGRWSSEYNVYG